MIRKQFPPTGPRPVLLRPPKWSSGLWASEGQRESFNSFLPHRKQPISQLTMSSRRKVQMERTTTAAESTIVTQFSHQESDRLCYQATPSPSILFLSQPPCPGTQAALGIMPRVVPSYNSCTPALLYYLPGPSNLIFFPTCSLMCNTENHICFTQALPLCMHETSCRLRG